MPIAPDFVGQEVEVPHNALLRVVVDGEGADSASVVPEDGA